MCSSSGSAMVSKISLVRRKWSEQIVRDIKKNGQNGRKNSEYILRTFLNAVHRTATRIIRQGDTLLESIGGGGGEIIKSKKKKKVKRHIYTYIRVYNTIWRWDETNSGKNRENRAREFGFLDPPPLGGT
jgi:hypothetical protein